MDEWQYEIAARNEQAARDEAERRAHDAIQPETHPKFDGAHCVECEEETPAERRALGKVRCVLCQTVVENPH